MTTMYQKLRDAMRVATWKYVHIATLSRSELMLGCMTDQELLDKWFNGSTADRARHPIYTKTWLEQNGITLPRKTRDEQWRNYLIGECYHMRTDDFIAALDAIEAKYS